MRTDTQIHDSIRLVSLYLRASEDTQIQDRRIFVHPSVWIGCTKMHKDAQRCTKMHKDAQRCTDTRQYTSCVCVSLCIRRYTDTRQTYLCASKRLCIFVIHRYKTVYPHEKWGMSLPNGCCMQHPRILSSYQSLQCVISICIQSMFLKDCCNYIRV